MNGLTSGLVTLVVSGALGVLTVVGCSADGSSGVIEDPFPASPEEGAKLPSTTNTSGGVTAPADAGKKEGGAKDGGKDSGVDAGPPPPVPGTPCTVANEIRTRPCGACGTQEAICQAADNKWSTYSTECVGETAGGCIPGTTVACGKCGIQTCSQFCALLGSCQNEPANACVPGGIELTNAGCPSSDLFKQRSCSSTCSAPNFSDACSPPPTIVEVPPTTDSVNWTIAILSENQTLPRFNTTGCPTPTFATVATPYVYVRVHNPLAKTATVAIYNSVAPGGVPYKTILAAYAGDTAPTDEASRKACLKATTYGSQSLTGDSNFASLDGAFKQVTIAAGGTVSVLVEASNAFDPAKPALSTGKVKLNVMTVSVD
jgi:hypothetical protein